MSTQVALRRAVAVVPRCRTPASRSFVRARPAASAARGFRTHASPAAALVTRQWLDAAPRVHASRALVARAFSDGAVVDLPVPSMGDSITEGTIIEWTKEPGDWVNADEVVCIIETDKVSVDVRSPQEGYLAEQLAAVDDVVEVGGPLAKIRSGERPAGAAAAPAADAEASAAEAPAAAAPADDAGAAAPAAPAAAAAAAAPAAAAKPAKATPPPGADGALGPFAAQPAPAAPTGTREERRIKMTRMRARIADRLKDSQNTAAMLTTFQECDMSGLINMRKQYKDLFEKVHDVKLGFMGAFIKASATALTEIPAVNAVIDGGDIVYRDYVDVSVAVSSPRGLVVPVIRNCESLGFAEIEASLGHLALKARNDDISLEDMAGGTFTVSNGGVFGSMLGTPIINPPQSAILGMHATKERPVVVDGEIVVRPVMYLALTYDHRLIDGREAVTFLCSVRDKIEDPRRLLLGV